MQSLFETAAGSVTGREHLRDLVWSNNQDSFFVDTRNDILVALVCDGCSDTSSQGQRRAYSHSEVGAKIGVRLIGNEILNFLHLSPRLLQNSSWAQVFWKVVQDKVLSVIKYLATEMGGNFSHTISDFFLFTAVGVLMTKEDSFFFSVGDGFLFINGEKINLGPFPDNEPPYFAYPLLDLAKHGKDFGSIKICRAMPTKDVQSVLIGTDGLNYFLNAEKKNLPGKHEAVGPISQFWESDIFFRNPVAVKRRLNLMNVEHLKIGPDQTIGREFGHLKDDTTMVVVRRRKEVSALESGVSGQSPDPS